jgi:hypothetical protein
MAYDVSSYEPGQGYDVAPDTGENPGGPQVESTPAPTGGEPAAPALKSADEARYDWMRKQGEARRAAAASAPAAKQTPAEEQPEPAGEQEHEQQQTETQPFELQVPSFVDNRAITDERQSFLNDFSALAPQIGIAAPEAQALLDTVVDCASSFEYEAREDASADDARLEVENLFGAERSKGLISQAQRYVASRGEAFQNYLDRTNLGNDPSVIVALAFAGAGWFDPKAATPEWAQKQLDEVMKSPEYGKGDRLALVKVHLLSRLVHKSERNQEQKLGAEVRTTPMSQEREAAATASTDVRAELAKLLSPKGPLLSGGPEQAAHKARYFELLKKI